MVVVVVVVAVSTEHSDARAALMCNSALNRKTLAVGRGCNAIATYCCCYL